MAAILLRLLLLISLVLPATFSQSLLKEGSFCNINQDCEHSCCLSKRCAPTYNDCLSLEQFDRFISDTYCSYHVDCASRCCLHGECESSYAPCFDRYDRFCYIGFGRHWRQNLGVVDCAPGHARCHAVAVVAGRASAHIGRWWHSTRAGCVDCA